MEDCLEVSGDSGDYMENVSTLCRRLLLLCRWI